MITSKVVVGALAALALAGCGTAGKAATDQHPAPQAATRVTPTASTTTRPLTLPVGDGVFVPSPLYGSKAMLRITVNSITEQTTALLPGVISCETSDRENKGGYCPPKSGSVYVVANVTYYCQGLETCSVDGESDWSVLTPDGWGEYEMVGKGPVLPTEDLAQGHTVTGNVSFSAPLNANELTFGESTDPSASWKIQP